MSENRSDPWLAESLRCTTFVTPASVVDPKDWWVRLTGEEAESTTSKPRTAEHRQEGPFGTGRLTLALDPMRIDWLHAGHIEERPGGYPVLGGFEDAISSFLELVKRWFALPSFPAVQRLALGAVLLQPVPSRGDGYRRLADYLPAVQIDAEGSSDFLYQINRPRRSSAQPEQILNRISRWSVGSYKQLRIPVVLQPVPQVIPGLLAGAEFSACRLEMDLSTSQNQVGELNHEKVPSVYNELVELAKDIAKNGDQP